MEEASHRDRVSSESTTSTQMTSSLKAAWSIVLGNLVWTLGVIPESCSRPRSSRLLKRMLPFLGGVRIRNPIPPWSLPHIPPCRRLDGGHLFRTTRLALSKLRCAHRLFPLCPSPSQEPNSRCRAPLSQHGASPLRQLRRLSTRYLARLTILMIHSLLNA